jgi:hypothetical protein
MFTKFSTHTMVYTQLYEIKPELPAPVPAGGRIT